MAADSVQRKLAAILIADVQGYSRLMGDDEVATIRTLTAYRQIMTKLIQQHHGRVVDSPGDNLLAEFGSAVDAVQGAVAVQNELKAKNAGLPVDRQMHYRIGINVGDVVVEGKQLYGDGVNIAARLESLADGGGICISEAVHMQVKNKLAIAFAYQGEQSVKNIVDPVRVYKVGLETEPAPPTIRPAQPAARPLSDKPSIAVLPFTNMSNDPEQEYFSDGITEDLITDLSQISGLFVIARNSVFTYKGQAVKVQEVHRALGVRYVLEGSVRKADNRVRITAQLVEAVTGGHVWAQRYDRDLDDIFALQDEVTQQIVAALEVKLTKSEEAQLEVRKSTRHTGRARIQRKQQEVGVPDIVQPAEDETVFNTPLSAQQFSSPRLLLRFHDREDIFPADQSPVILGRSKQSDFEVPGQFASRQHARIEWHQDNFVLIDQSSNSTFIRTDEGTEVILERTEQYVLHGTGVISLGQSLDTAAGEVIHFRVED